MGLITILVHNFFYISCKINLWPKFFIMMTRWHPQLIPRWLESWPLCWPLVPCILAYLETVTALRFPLRFRLRWKDQQEIWPLKIGIYNNTHPQKEGNSSSKMSFKLVVSIYLYIYYIHIYIIPMGPPGHIPTHTLLDAIRFETLTTWGSERWRTLAP